MKINPLIKSSIIYVIATVIGQGMSFLGIIIFTRFMSQEAYGQYSTYYAYVSIFTVLISANLYYSLNNAYIDKKDEIKEYRKSVLTLSVIIATSVFLICWIIDVLLLKKDSTFIVVMAALHSYGFFAVNYRIYSANMENDYKKKQWLLILPNTLQLFGAMVLVLMFSGNGYYMRVIGSTCGVFLVGIIVFAEMYGAKGRLVNTEHWKYALRISVPSIVMSLSYMLMQQCDKVMITKICGADETAVYSVIYYLGYAIIAVDQAVRPVRQSWVYKRLDDNDISTIKTIQKWYLVLMGILITGVFMVGPEIIKTISPSSYWRYEYILPFIIGAGMMLLYSFYTEVIMFYKKNASLSLCVFLCAVINVGLNFLMIPRFGAVAACYTTVVSYFLLFVLTYVLNKRLALNIYSIGYFAFFIIGVLFLGTIFEIVKMRIIVRYCVFLGILALMVIYVVHHGNEWRRFINGGRN